MAFQSALESNKNISSTINKTSVEQLAIVFTHFLYATAGICVRAEKRQ